MNGEIKTVYLGTTELINTILDFLHQYGRVASNDFIETLLSNLLLDMFAPSSTEGHVDNTLQVLATYNFKHEVAYDFVLTLYNQLLYQINTTRMSSNLNYLDKLIVDMHSLQLIKLTYDPAKKTSSTYLL